MTDIDALVTQGDLLGRTGQDRGPFEAHASDPLHCQQADGCVWFDGEDVGGCGMKARQVEAAARPRIQHAIIVSFAIRLRVRYP